MTDTLHRRLRREVAECAEDPANLPDSSQNFLEMVDRVFLEAGFTGADPGEHAPGSGPQPEVLDSLPDIVFVIADDGTIVECRGGDQSDLAFPRQQLIGRSVARCPFGDTGARFRDAMSKIRENGKPLAIEYSLPRDQGLAHFEARLTRSADGRFLAVVRNVTGQAASAVTALQSGFEYRELLYSLHAAVLLFDPRTGEVLECSRGAGTLYGVDRAGLVGTQLDDLFLDPAHLPDLKSLAANDSRETVESWHRLRDGSVLMVEMSLSRVRFRGRIAILSVNREIEQPSERPETRHSLSMLQATFDATADGILVVDQQGNYVTSNRLFAEMWGIPVDLLQAGREQEAAAVVLALLENPASLVEELISIHASADTHCTKIVELIDGRFFESVSMPQLISGEQAGRVWSFRDVTNRMKSEERIRHHAYHDSLTGLPNRTLFHDRLSQDLGRSRRAGRSTALLLLDLDRFKTINDTLGHASGDKLLVEVARRLESRRRDGDTIARLGGDEFVFVISQLRHKEDAAIIAEQVLDVLKPPILIADHELFVSASIGIAIFPEDGEEGTALMKSADVALYRAKELGRDNYQIYEPKLSQRAMDRLVMEKDLRRAIENEEFILHYQPQYDLRTRKLRGVEALIRWMQDGSVVPPNKFIPIAEECGLVVQLGRWVVEESARQCAEFNHYSREPLRVCVNVSALQIQRPNFANEVSQILQKAGVPLKQLVVELTESALMQNPEQGSWAMAQLEQMGVGVAMDDFGTGHSSLTHLSHLPISMIKIDRSFVINCATRKTDAAILEAIVTMGHALGLKVLAEGVETEEQAKVLLRHGCDEVQGYLYSRPVSAEEVMKIIRRDQ